VAHETIRRLKLPVDESARAVPSRVELDPLPFSQIDHHQHAYRGPLSQIDRHRASSAFVLTDRKIARASCGFEEGIVKLRLAAPTLAHHEDY
jgi:hypothetical protein